ncbi:MAG: hypothetical protein WCT04_20065 [Planctomycetota bacterium]
MKTKTISGARWPRAIWITLLCCLSAGCGKRVEYLTNDHKLTRLNQDQPAPRPGVLISEGYLAELFEALGRPKPNADSPDSKNAPAGASPNGSAQALFPAAPTRR